MSSGLLRSLTILSCAASRLLSGWFVSYSSSAREILYSIFYELHCKWLVEMEVVNLRIRIAEVG